MLEKVDLSKTMDKKKMKAVLDEESAKLSILQRACRTAGIPVMIVFEGLALPERGHKSTD